MSVNVNNAWSAAEVAAFNYAAGLVGESTPSGLRTAYEGYLVGYSVVMDLGQGKHAARLPYWEAYQEATRDSDSMDPIYGHIGQGVMAAYSQIIEPSSYGESSQLPDYLQRPNPIPVAKVTF